MPEFKAKDRVLIWLMKQLGSRLVLLFGRTVHYELTGREHLQRAVEESPTGTYIFAVPHGRMFLPVLDRRDKGITALVSQSADGEAVAQLVHRLGYRTVRGSTARGAAEGMLGMIRTARRSVIANMVDGPRGPRLEPKIGTVAIARSAGIPIVPLVGAAQPSKVFERSWDRFQLPLPFSRGIVLIGEPMFVPKSAKGEQLEKAREELKRRVVESVERADTMLWKRVAGRPRGLLLLPSTLWSLATRIRNRMYDTGMRRTEPSPVPVVSVGNLTVGGSGKSPLVREVTQRLRDKGRSPAIVSRGYRRKSSGLRVVADRKGLRMSAQAGGDEPVMLARQLPGVPVLVSERRPEGIEEAARRHKADVAVLDDGFQHRAAARDLDIVLLDASAPAWHWRMLPAGRMREPFSALKRAGLVVITGKAPEGIVAALIRRVRSVTAAPVARGGLEPSHLTRLNGEEEEPLEWLDRRRLAVAAAIARPRRFFDSVESLGAELAAAFSWNDHRPLTRKQVDPLMAKARRRKAAAVLITEKDAAKWPVPAPDDLPVYVLRTRWVWHSDERELDTALETALREPAAG